MWVSAAVRNLMTGMQTEPGHGYFMNPGSVF